MDCWLTIWAGIYGAIAWTLGVFFAHYMAQRHEIWRVKRLLDFVDKHVNVDIYRIIVRERIHEIWHGWLDK